MILPAAQLISLVVLEDSDWTLELDLLTLLVDIAKKKSDVYDALFLTGNVKTVRGNSPEEKSHQSNGRECFVSFDWCDISEKVSQHCENLECAGQ